MAQEIKTMDLINELESLQKGLSPKETIEQSDCFVFMDDGTVMTYNDNIAATGKTTLDLEGAVEAQPLLRLLNNTKDETISVEIEDEELRIKGKRFSTGIKLEKEIMLPTSDIEIPSPKSFEKTPSNFSKLAKLACLTASKSTNSGVLTCVHIEENRIESCDNDRITICYMDENYYFDEVLIPANNLTQIVKENIVGLKVDDPWVHFKTDEDFIYSTRIFPADYVDLQEHIPDEEGRQIEFPAETESIINRADVFGLDETSKSKFARIQIKKGKLTVTTRNQNGWFKESVKVKSKENISFSINTDFLRDVLKMTDSITIVDHTLVFMDEQATHLVQLEEE